MNTYLGFACAGDKEPGQDAFSDGESLAARCCDQLSASDGSLRFPPQLLIFLASAKYLENDRAHDLVPGIETFFNRRVGNRVPLIGSSVAAVIFDRKVHESGAVLICLASKLLNAKVAAASEFSEPSQSLGDLAKVLEIRPEDPRKGRPRKLLVFLPGTLYHRNPESLYKSISVEIGYQLPITGGVSHPVTAVQDPGLQFTEFGVQRGAIVAARIEFDAPVASGLRRSLKPVEPEKLATVRNRHGSPQIERAILEELTRNSEFALLGKTVDERDVAVVVVTRREGKIEVRNLRDFQDGEQLKLLAADPERIYEQAVFSITEPLRRVQMANPAGSIAFHCASYYRHHKEIRLNFEEELGRMEEKLETAPVVGGFFAGEIGVDFSGRSMLANFAGATLTFGDEMQERYMRQRGFEAIAGASSKLNKAESVLEVITESLEMIENAGYVGSMISMLLPDGRKDCVVPKDARGERFEKEMETAKQPGSKMKPLSGEEARAARDGQPRYISDPADPSGKDSVWLRQYIVPLSGYTGRAALPSTASDRKDLTFGFLYIDLGKSRRDEEPHEDEKKVLNSLGAAVESALARVLIGEEARIMQALDETMGDVLRELSENPGRRFKTMGETLMQSPVDACRHLLVKAAVEDAFHCGSGHIRMRRESKLEVVAGFGPDYDLIHEAWREFDVTDKVLAARAFSLDEPMVLNDPANDEMYQNFRARSSGPDDLSRRKTTYLGRPHSFAAAVLKDAVGQKLGTVIIHADEPWWFYNYHLRCLERFDERLRTVVDHLGNTLPNQFLRQIDDYLPVPHSHNMEHALKVVVQNFQKASAAQVVSLFLWEESFQRFLLYAETGWKKSGWELAAYYAQHEGWTGSVALEDEPRYEEDLRTYKQSIASETDKGTYESAMFGSRDDFATESIGLPLKVGGKSIGVLIALRRYQRKKKREGFVTIEKAVLKPAADRITCYLSALLLQRNEQLDQEKEDRYRAINRAISADEEFKPSLEEILCRQLKKQYEAEEVSFYNKELECTAGEPRKDRQPDEMVKNASRAIRNAEPQFETVKLDDERERQDPDLAASHGLLWRACIPLVIRSLLGVIDIRWRQDVKRLGHPLRHGYDKELRAIGKMIASVYQRHQAEVELKNAKNKAESVEARSIRLADAMVAPAKQALHRCNNLDALLDGLEKATFAGRNLDEIISRIREIRMSTRQLPRAMQFLKTGTRPEQGDVELEQLVNETVSEFNWSKDIRCIQSLAPGLIVNANREWLREAFFNIIDNGIRAIRDKGEPGVVTISATAADEKVQIVFKDTGIGMADEEREAVMHGSLKIKKPRRTGVGVPLTRVLLAEQGGDLNINSQKGFGTDVTVTLRLIRRIDHVTNGSATASGGSSNSNSDHRR